MNKENLSIHTRVFNDRVRAMNQTQSKDLVLSAGEARNLHSDIFNLLARIAELESVASVAANNNPINLDLDGGKF